MLPRLPAMLQRSDEAELRLAVGQWLDVKLVQAFLAAKRLLNEPIPTVPLPVGEVFMHPLPRGTIPTNVPAYLLALDPLVLLDFLLLGPKHVSQRILFSMS
jgi:hypothetical protein